MMGLVLQFKHEIRTCCALILCCTPFTPISHFEASSCRCHANSSITYQTLQFSNGFTVLSWWWILKRFCELLALLLMLGINFGDVLTTRDVLIVRQRRKIINLETSLKSTKKALKLFVIIDFVSFMMNVIFMTLLCYLKG
ncbi:hypothetical protein CR513_22493, partial [Mucuna pruriens]